MPLAWPSSGIPPRNSRAVLPPHFQAGFPAAQGFVCAQGSNAHRWRRTYQSPTRPTCRGAFRYGYRCQGQGEDVRQCSEHRVGRHLFPNRVPALRGVKNVPGLVGVSMPTHPRFTGTFRKALFSSMFMITGGMAEVGRKEMSSQCSQPPASSGTPSHTARDQLQSPNTGGGGDTHPWLVLPCQCGTPPPGKWPSGLLLWIRPGGSHSHP